MFHKARLESEHFPHRILWSTVGELRELLDHDHDLIRSVGCAVLLLTHNCFEAYLNYAGELLLPNVWKDERSNFSKDPYRGLMGKLQCIADELGVTINRGRNPYRTVRELKTWRDRVVHPKIERQVKVVSYTKPEHIKNLDTAFFSKVKVSFIDRALKNVEDLCDGIQAKASKLSPKQFLSPKSFKGIMGTSGGCLLP